MRYGALSVLKAHSIVKFIIQSSEKKENIDDMQCIFYIFTSEYIYKILYFHSTGAGIYFFGIASDFSIVFFIQFNVPFKIISQIETNQSIGGAKREYPGKTT